MVHKIEKKEKHPGWVSKGQGRNGKRSRKKPEQQ